MALKSIYNMLSPTMRERTPWQSKKTPPFAAIDQTLSGQIWVQIPGGHKWLGYFPIYDREFMRFRNKQPRVLEIGVYRGASLMLWSHFFGEGAYVVGIDINPACAAFDQLVPNTFVEIGDQSDPAFLQSVIDKHGPFDLIIDDGSHVASHQIASFNGLFEKGLKDDGIYFVEDLECMYWGHTDEFRDAPITSTDFFKMLVDVQNSIYEDYTYHDFAVHIPGTRSDYTAIDIAKSIAGIRFYRGVALVEKSPQVPPLTLHI
jgi:SAM-dependent methyltransferase